MNEKTGEVLPPNRSVPGPVASPARGKHRTHSETVIVRDRRGLVFPIGVAISLCIIGLVAFMVWNIWSSSEATREAHETRPHRDGTVVQLNVARKLSADEVRLVLRQLDGRLVRVVAKKDATSKFTNDTLVYLQSRRDRVKNQLKRDLDRVFSDAFSDREQAVSAYADWFFAWGRSWALLWEGIKGAAVEASKLALSRTKITDAARHEVEAYLIRHYTEFVLKPEIRDPSIIAGVRKALKQAHEEYLFAISGLDARLQQFMADHALHTEPLSADQAVTVALDWDAQKWKTPRYALEDKALEVVGSIGVIAGSTVIVGPVLEATIIPLFAETIAEIMISTEWALGGALALSEVPLLGTALGAALGLFADRALAYFREKMQRKDFVRENLVAVDATVKQWKGKASPPLMRAIDVWFDDAQAAVVIKRGR